MKNYLLRNSVSELIKNSDMCKVSFKEWIEALTEVYGEATPKTLLKILKAKIMFYDISKNVNSFIIGDSLFWLDKNTRVGLMHLANCSLDNIELVLGDKVLTIPVDVAKSFLALLEVYAGKCYLQTLKHLLAAEKLHTIEDIINYDYTAGYPDKITFNA